ncbi:MAG: UDP-N-acetylmuramate dehydrogenase, partial [Chloroflexota bacterium]
QPMNTLTLPTQELRDAFGENLKENEPLARHTSSRIGGPADFLITVNSSKGLADAILQLAQLSVQFEILGGGSNLLVSDAGFRGVVILNKARNMRFAEVGNTPSVFAESGSNFGALARKAAQKGFAGLEWAGGIPGTLGGAIFGNAGAHGSEIADNLVLAEVLHIEKGKQTWKNNQFGFQYRNSVLNDSQGKVFVLSATLALETGNAKEIEAKMDEYVSFRRKTQPPGASMGSMFKNPDGDFAGRLIDAAGLKGKQIGAAQISELHGNFFLNHGNAMAEDVYTLLKFAQKTVAEKFNVNLKFEIQLFGEWNE